VKADFQAIFLTQNVVWSLKEIKEDFDPHPFGFKLRASCIFEGQG
jgi:hypothetical protein